MQWLEQLRSLLTREAMQCLVISSSKTLKSAACYLQCHSFFPFCLREHLALSTTNSLSQYYYRLRSLLYLFGSCASRQYSPQLLQCDDTLVIARERATSAGLSPESWKAGRGTIKRQMWSSQTEDAERASKKKTKQKAGAIVAASLKTERTVATASRH
jgi:hypothetical protein